MSSLTAEYSVPFDHIADSYDATFSDSLLGRAQRAVVWRELEKTFSRGDRVLEIGCGTGMDACFLAERGVFVLACDSSPRMLQAATQRVRSTKNQERVQPYLLAAENIDRLQPRESFDGAFSNFGALNCVEDLDRLAQELAVLIRPGGTLLFCLMGPWCLWEMVWYACQGKLRKAFRRSHHGAIDARIADNATVRVRYPSVHSLANSFSPAFKLRGITGVGVAVPPSYINRFAERFPRWLDLAIRADSFLGHFPGSRALADHLLLKFERVPAVTP